MHKQQQNSFWLFYDGACPLCEKEVQWLKRRKTKANHTLHFIDISQPSFNANEYDKSMEDFMGELHLRNADGEWLKAMEATRMIYRIIGLGWLMAPTGWPGLRALTDMAYRVFARYRPRRKSCTDRCNLPSEKQ